MGLLDYMNTLLKSSQSKALAPKVKDYNVPIPPATYWRQQYDKYAGKSMYIPGGGGIGSSFGGTPGPISTTIKLPPRVPAKAPSGLSPVQTSTPAVPQMATPSSSPLPLSTAQTPTGQDSGASLQALLASLSVPGQVQHLNTQMPALSGVDLKHIYDKYAPMETSAYDQLIQTLGGIRQGAQTSGDAQRAATESRFGALNADITAGNAANKGALDDLIQRLGLQEAQVRPEYQAISTNEQRLKGLLGLTQNQRLDTQRGLDSARLGNFDTLSQLAAGGKTKSLQDLLDTVTSGEIQGELNKASTQNEIAKIFSSGEIDLQKLIMQLRDSELNRNMSLYKLASDQAAAQQANNPYSETITTTSENEDFKNALDQLTQGSPVAGKVWQQAYNSSGGSLSDAQKALTSLSQRAGGVTTIAKINDLSGMQGANSFVGGGGTVANTGGGVGNGEADAAKQLLDLFNILGGSLYPSTKRTVTVKNG